MREGPHGDGLYLTEEQVAQEFENEMMFWGAQPQVKAVCWYQINDGNDRKNELHTYGIRRFNGEWKPIARRVAEVRKRLEDMA
jgi:hypothetical protein